MVFSSSVFSERWKSVANVILRSLFEIHISWEIMCQQFQLTFLKLTDSLKMSGNNWKSQVTSLRRFHVALFELSHKISLVNTYNFVRHMLSTRRQSSWKVFKWPNSKKCFNELKWIVTKVKCERVKSAFYCLMYSVNI